ncbi:MAG: hypothetical protein HUK40_13025 [Desulfobacter sp.]|nr:hypothetical protein [Desulfobacter sp.]WDP83803.1 MAG: hypothetical protein HUN05_00325 [Desulfobacter sp.]
MKRLSVYFSLAILVFGFGLAHAECKKGHTDQNPHKMGRIQNTSFEDMDLDKSQGVSFEEFKALFPQTSQRGFNTLDTDKDGQLNKAEWKVFKDAHKGMGNDKKAPETT